MTPFSDPQRAQELFADLRPSPSLEVQLRARFRKHHRVRGIGRWLLASAAALACLIFLSPPFPRQSNATEFYPLPGTTLTTAMLGSAQIVRVELTPTALAQLGLPVQDEPVEAELLLTPDGLPRGIRFLP
jgi:hypothetical protein